MDLAAAFLLSLLGGYCFVYVWRGTRFTTRRIDGHHLYFRAALCGAVLFSIALAVRIELVGHSPAYRSFDSTLFEYIRPVLKVESGLALPAAGTAAESSGLPDSQYEQGVHRTCRRTSRPGSRACSRALTAHTQRPSRPRGSAESDYGLRGSLFDLGTR